MNGLPILTYHAVDKSKSVISTDPRWFATTMATLRAEGFESVDLQSWIEAGRPAVERGFAITFDDGLACLKSCAETIAKHGFIATAFLVTGWMGRENRWPGQLASVPASSILKWSDLANLETAGFRFGAHTVHHPNLNDCDNVRIEAELNESRRSVEDRTGRCCPLFAYPYGRFSSRVRRIVSEQFDAAFTTRLDVCSSREDVFSLSRIDAYYLRSPRNLKRLIGGNWSGWLRARRAARAVRAAIPLA